MPRLSLYKPEKGNNYKFIDKKIYQMFQVGGTDIYLHKYIGPTDPSDPNKALGESTIQDVLFGENRDRKYDSSVYTIRGVYNVQDIDFNLSQFGLFLQNDIVFMTVHINNTVETIGRKLMAGDVLELPHLIDYYALNSLQYALRKFYVIEDITRAAEGFSVTWWPHLYRLKLRPMPDSQEFKDITNKPVDEDNFAGDWECEKTYYPGQIIRFNGILYEVLQQADCIDAPNSEYYRPLEDNEIQSGNTDYDTALEINQSIIAEAEADAKLSGYETQHFFTLSLDENQNVNLITVDQSNISIDSANFVNRTVRTPVKDGYSGYLLGDGIPPNGAPYGFGIQFPGNAAVGDFFLRTDYLPNRLFRYDGVRWVKYEDKVRMTLTNTDDRQTQKTSFINNSKTQSNIKLLQTDTFIVEANKVFRPDDPTLSMDIVAKKIVTKTVYQDAYGVEVWINDTVNPVLEKINENGNLAFIVKNNLTIGSTLMWSIYQQTIPQRQALSKALRPRADF
jgi:hypothetical protein